MTVVRLYEFDSEKIEVCVSAQVTNLGESMRIVPILEQVQTAFQTYFLFEKGKFYKYRNAEVYGNENLASMKYHPHIRIYAYDSFQNMWRTESRHPLSFFSVHKLYLDGLKKIGGEKIDWDLALSNDQILKCEETFMVGFNYVSPDLNGVNNNLEYDEMLQVFSPILLMYKQKLVDELNRVEKIISILNGSDNDVQS